MKRRERKSSALRGKDMQPFSITDSHQIIQGESLAIDVFNIIDKGAYQSVDAIPDRTLLYAGGPYKISASRVSAHSVYTNHPHGCAFREASGRRRHILP